VGLSSRRQEDAVLPPTSRTIAACAATAISRDRALPPFESFIYVIIAGLLLALPIMIPLLHPSAAAAGTAQVIAYADEIDAVLAEAEEARRSVDALLAGIRDDCVPAGSSTAELSMPESGATVVPQSVDSAIAPARCRVIGAATTD